jgi:hypothetical protein
MLACVFAAVPLPAAEKAGPPELNLLAGLRFESKV